MNRKRFGAAVTALCLLCIALLALPAQAEEVHTCEELDAFINDGIELVPEDQAWYDKNCVEEEVVEEEEPEYRPPDVTCPRLPDQVAVYGFSQSTQCQMVDESGIGRSDLIERGVLDAVDVWNHVPADGVEVCFRKSGSLVFLDATYIQRLLMNLESYTRDGMTCGVIDRIGTVVLLKPAAGEAPAALPPFEPPLQTNCQIKLVETLFLRAAPAGKIIGLVWLNSEVPVFEISGYWYKVEFEGEVGYISRFYRKVLSGSCG